MPPTMCMSTRPRTVLDRPSSRSVIAHGISFICAGRNTPKVITANSVAAPRKRQRESTYPFTAPIKVETIVAGIAMASEFHMYGWIPVQLPAMQ